MTRRIEIEWYHTETFTATVEVEDDFDLNGEDADEDLEEIICNFSRPEEASAFTGCTDRQITRKKEVSDDPV